MAGTERKHRILVVDDNELLLRIAAATLQKMGFEVVGAISGSEGLRLVETFKPEVVVVDFHMPDMTGPEFTRRLRRLDGFNDTPVVGMSSSDPGSGPEFVEAGADLFVAKPLRDHALLAAVRRLLEQRRPLRSKQNAWRHLWAYQGVTPPFNTTASNQPAACLA